MKPFMRTIGRSQQRLSQLMARRRARSERNGNARWRRDDGDDRGGNANARRRARAQAARDRDAAANASTKSFARSAPAVDGLLSRGVTRLALQGGRWRIRHPWRKLTL